jgi:hypothetical protein
MDFQKVIDELKEIDEFLADEINKTEYHRASGLCYISDYTRMLIEWLIEYNKVNVKE